jgi:hypothetical protein
MRTEEDGVDELAILAWELLDAPLASGAQVRSRATGNGEHGQRPAVFDAMMRPRGFHGGSCSGPGEEHDHG